MKYLFAQKKKKSIKHKVTKKKKKVTKKSTVKKTTKRNSLSKKKASLVDMIDRSNYVVFYYAGAYALIFGLFAVAIYYSN
tara:strand:+ start:331 stop:570 length:240 start_codon:yes stop_codon:yes gene_type:complete